MQIEHAKMQTSLTHFTLSSAHCSSFSEKVSAPKKYSGKSGLKVCHNNITHMAHCYLFEVKDQQAYLILAHDACSKQRISFQVLN